MLLKIPVFNANSVDPLSDDTFYDVWSRSTLFANVLFIGRYAYMG